MTPGSSPASGGALTVLKIGGELIETRERIAALVPALAALAGDGPLLVVHGGGKDIDAEAARRGLTKQAIEGLRITDDATLDAVVAALAGTVNTRLVAALAGAGVRAIGLTGADAFAVPAKRAPQHRTVDGRLVDLGLVGEPVMQKTPAVLLDLLILCYVPVVACLGCTDEGQILNINADTLAAALARSCGAARLVIAGATAGVLDADGSTIPQLDMTQLDAMIQDGRASAGMVAKLRACREAVMAGVTVSIVDGRAVTAFSAAPGTHLVGAVTPFAG